MLRVMIFSCALVIPSLWMEAATARQQGGEGSTGGRSSLAPGASVRPTTSPTELREIILDFIELQSVCRT